MIVRDLREVNAVDEGLMLALWGRGLDTASIARHLRLFESQVYNRLFHLRQREAGR